MYNIILVSGDPTLSAGRKDGDYFSAHRDSAAVRIAPFTMTSTGFFLRHRSYGKNSPGNAPVFSDADGVFQGILHPGAGNIVHLRGVIGK